METEGRDASDPATSIVGIGFADEDGSWYVDVRKWWKEGKGPGGECWGYLIERLRHRRLTAFNVTFDWSFLWAKWGLSDLEWESCTYGLFRQLATEGFEGQEWNLGTIESDVLGWQYSNKRLLGEMLSRHGLTKSEMAKLADLEPEDFGRYCAEDADAHWQAHDELVRVVENLGPEGEYLASFHKGPWFTSAVRLNVEQQLRGIKINVPKLTAYRDQLIQEIADKKEEFFSIPEVIEPIKEWNQKYVDQHLEKESTKIKKDGSKGKAWDKWKAKLEDLKATNFFNPNSTQQLAWLLFEKLGYPIKEYTDKGAPSVSMKFMMFWGAPGRTLLTIKKKIKILGSFVENCLALQRDGILHPITKSVGAISGRAAGGDKEDE